MNAQINVIKVWSNELRALLLLLSKEKRKCNHSKN